MKQKNTSPSSRRPQACSENEAIDRAARKILEKYKKAFEELAK